MTEITEKHGVNGEKSLKGMIYNNQSVIHGIGRGWRISFNNEEYVVIYAKPIDDGDNVIIEFDAVHEFFYEMKKSVISSAIDGSNTMKVYLDFVFDGIDYNYVLEESVSAFSKDNFGYDNRLALFHNIIKQTGMEYSVNGRVVRIISRMGEDLTTVVRKKLNLQDLGIEKNIGNFITQQTGLGAWYDEDDHSKGRLTVTYTSPLAEVYGVLEGNPIVDERYSVENNLREVLKSNVENSYKISVQLTMEDLTKAGYRYEHPRVGDQIMVINEKLGFKQKIRIVSYETDYDVNGILLDHRVTCNSFSMSQKGLTDDLKDLVSSIGGRIEQTEINAKVARQEASRAIVDASKKVMAYYGSRDPQLDYTLRPGDLWFDDSTETTISKKWNGYEWDPLDESSDKRITEVKTEIENISESTQWTLDQIESALKDGKEVNLADLFAKQMGEDDVNTLFYQLADSVGLVYSEDGVRKAIIAIEDGKPYIKGEHVVLDGNTIVNGDFTVTEEMIAPSAIIDRLKTQGIDAGQINVIGLNMDHIAGGSIELTKGFKITNNGQDVLSIDQNGQTVFNAPNVATKDDLKTIELTPGPPGQDGEDGLPGKDGRDSYTHIAYATGTEGQSFSQSTFEQATHIGMYVSNNQASSTNWRDYEWTLIKGKDGKDGSDGVSVSSTIMQFYQSTSSTELEGGVWSDTPPNWKDGQYIWTRVATNYSNGQTSVSDPVNATGQTGSTGQSGRSVVNVSGQYYLSSSKEQRTGGAWVDSPPIWQQGFYVWTRLKIDYSNPSGTEYTEPTVDSSWEAIDELVYENRNYFQLSQTDKTHYVGDYRWEFNFNRQSALSISDSTIGTFLEAGTYTLSFYANVGEDDLEDHAQIRIGELYDDGQIKTITYVGRGTDYIKAGELNRHSYELTLKKDTTITLQAYSHKWDGDNYVEELIIERVKIEKGPKATQYSVAPEDIQDQIDSKADQESLDEVSTELSDFQTVVASREEVGEITSALYDYIDDLNRNERDLESAKEDIDNLLTRLPIIENNLGAWVERWSFLDTYVTLGDEGLMISEMNGSTGIRISKDRIDFMDGSGEPVAYITNQIMRINRGIFVDSMQVGEHKVETIAEGHTIWQWMGG